MKTPLRYQSTEYDCGPTCLINAVSLLFQREEIPPEVPRNLMLYSLDAYGEDGTFAKYGTSHAAMRFMSHWLNVFGKSGRLDIRSSYITGEDVNWEQQGPLRDALRRGGVAVVRIDLELWHYVLLTGVDEKSVYVFDPYYLPDPFPVEGVQSVHDHPFDYNRIVPIERFDSQKRRPYSFGPYETREAVLLYNSRTTPTEGKTEEHVI